jgi:aminoglycoside 2'-N-acetyltransferase I
VELLVLESADVDASLRRGLDRLWHEAFDDFTAEDGEHAYGGVHVLVRAAGLDVVAHASAVPRTITFGDQPLAAGYVEGVAVSPRLQGSGLGSRVMARLDDVVRERWDVGVLGTGEPDFYERLGWERWRGPSYVHGTDGTRRRSADEDGGLMVLRFGASAGLDLDLPITCEDRSGDAW